MPAALALVLLLSACGEPEVSLEELRQQAEDGACVLSVDADVEAGRDTWMRFYEATQAEEDAEVTLVSWYSGDPFGVSRQDRFYTYHLSFTDGVYTLTAEGAEGETVSEQYAHLLRFEEEPDVDSGARYQKGDRLCAGGRCGPDMERGDREYGEITGGRSPLHPGADRIQ